MSVHNGIRQLSADSSLRLGTGEARTMAEHIFLQTDRLFNLVLYVTQELGNRLEVDRHSIQSARIEQIAGSHADVLNKFGGRNVSRAKCRQSFASTAQAVFRMCMLRAAGVPEAHWPSGTPRQRTRERNVGNMIHEYNGPNPGDPGFILAQDDREARMYYSSYDRLYPQFYIAQKIIDVDNPQDRAQLSSMMLIFRRNFQDIIEINTTAHVREDQEEIGRYECSVDVRVRRRNVLPGADTLAMVTLRRILGPEQDLRRHFQRLQLQNSEDEDESESEDEDESEGEGTGEDEGEEEQEEEEEV